MVLRLISTHADAWVRNCECCGKNTVKRKGTSPAPISLFAGSFRIYLCMGCAKRISSALDTVIERIENRYGC